MTFIACLLVGNTVVQFARRFPSAGSFYTYNSNALGKTAGFFTGWLFWIGYAVLAPGLFTPLGAFASEYMNNTFAASAPWWVFSLAGMTVVVGLSIRSIQASARVDLTLLVIEVAVFLLLAVITIMKAGRDNTLVVGFSVGAWLGPGATGAYGFLGTVGTVAIVIVYLLSNIALVRFYSGLPERSLLLHVVVPVLGVLALAYPLWAVAQPGQAYPLNLVPIIVGVWLLIGAAIYAYLREGSAEVGRGRFGAGRRREGVGRVPG